jgi:hypothetical protein
MPPRASQPAKESKYAAVAYVSLDTASSIEDSAESAYLVFAVRELVQIVPRSPTSVAIVAEKPHADRRELILATMGFCRRGEHLFVLDRFEKSQKVPPYIHSVKSFVFAVSRGKCGQASPASVSFP